MAEPKKIDKENLEKALGNTEKERKIQMPREMELGFHQGSLNTLVNERNELIKLIQQIERVMQAHVKRLEELGVKIKTTSANEKK
jgi:hypothetical protein